MASEAGYTVGPMRRSHILGWLPAAALLMAAGGTQSIPLAASEFKNIDKDSGKGHDYRFASEDGHPYLAVDYHPGQDPTTLGYRLPDNLRKAETRVSWKWRVRVFPKNGDECFGERGDSAAALILTFHSGLKWTLLKYIWSEVEPAGTVCDKRSNLFLVRQTTVLEKGGQLGAWKAESVDPKAEYVKHFGGKREDVPDLVGVGVLTDGDNTQSVSAGDYSDFVLEAEAKP
jgi:hypothetical protein